MTSWTHIPARARRALAVAVGVLAVSATAATAQSPVKAPAEATARAFAFVNASGNETIGKEFPVSGAGSQVGSSARTIVHKDIGEYDVFLAVATGRGEPLGGDQGGVAHVRATGSIGGVCQTSSNIDSTAGASRLQIPVHCSDNFGRPANRPFTLSYTRGGSETGSLATVREAVNFGPIDPAGDFPVQDTSIDGVRLDPADPETRSIVLRTGPGAVTVETAVLPGTGPATIQVSPLISSGRSQVDARGAVCGVVGVANAQSAIAGRGLVTQTKVQCRGPAGTGPINVPIALSIARGINPLGTSRLNTAYVNVPLTTAASTVLPAGSVLNTVSGIAGGATLKRIAAGRYEVALANQQKHGIGDTFSVTAEGSTADCQVTRNVTDVAKQVQRLGIACSGAPALQGVDTAFRLQYTATPQPVGTLRLTPALVRTRPGAIAHLRLSWTHPRSWRELRRVELRVSEGANAVGRVVVRPGASRLRARGAIRLVTPGSRLVHHGRTVTAELALRVDRAPAAQPLRVDVAAVDRRGRRQLEPGAAAIRVR